MPECLIIGAGITGLTAAGVLQDHGWKVALLDKGREVGGRMATQRIGESRFDHGAQFFTVRDPRFKGAVEDWISAGWAGSWFEEGGHHRYCARQGMNSLTKHLARRFDVRTRAEAALIWHGGNAWHVNTTSGEEFRADALLMTPPAPQTLDLLSGLPDLLPQDFMRPLEDISFDPCFALMAVVRGHSRIPHPGYIRPEQGPIAWLSDNTQKGLSEGNSAVTIHAGPESSRVLFDAPREDVARVLLDAAEPYFGSEVLEWQLHRWNFSQPIAVCPQSCLYTAYSAPLAVAGDAFKGPRVEGAFLSGLAAAEALVQSK
jgi:renalase